MLYLIALGLGVALGGLSLFAVFNSEREDRPAAMPLATLSGALIIASSILYLIH